MSKFIAISILTILTTIPSAVSRRSAPSLPPPDEMEVMILFSGLMVFNLNKETNAYEVGILNDASNSHEFCVQQQGATRVCRGDLPAGTKWSITTTKPPADSPVSIGHGGKRRPDHENGQHDFDWIVDLDGPGFHNQRLELAPGHLKPIIKLPRARLFTKYKSPDFVRWKGEKPADPPVFGFVAETIGFQMKLRKGESLVLKDDETNKNIFTVSYRAPSPVGGNYEVISISNIRPSTSDETSDFRMYYHLFPEVAKSEQFDFEENRKDPMVPFNLLPRYETCCSLVCTQVRLVNWNQPLH